MPRGGTGSSASRMIRRRRPGRAGHQDAQAAAEDIGLFPDHEGRDVFPRLRSIINTARKGGWNVIEILTGSPERVAEALGYPAEVLDAFENCLKGGGVDVEELDIVDKKDKAAKQS